MDFPAFLANPFEIRIFKGDSSIFSRYPLHRTVTPAGFFANEGFISVYGGFSVIIVYGGYTFGESYGV